MLIERHPELRADIVVAGLPQQDEPVGDALLDVVRPKLVVIADSEFPVSRRASAALRARLERRGIPILYTRDAGAVTVSLRPPCWEARTMSGLRVTGQSGAAISINPN
jgi:beta-lactamase superfamily II metal-dependent hydrolase